MSDFSKSLMQGLGSAIGGIPGALAGTFLGSIFGGNSAKTQLKHQMQLQQQQFDLQKQMFDYTSEYNSASNQVQRLKEAGLNPNLAYGNGVQAGGVTGSVASGQAAMPNNQASQIGYDSPADLALKQSQVDYYKAKAQSEILKNLEQEAKNKYAEQLFKNQVDLSGKQILESEAKTELYKQNAITEAGRALHIKAQTMNEIANIANTEADTKVKLKQLEAIGADIGYKKALTAVAVYQIDVMASQIDLNKAMADDHSARAAWQLLRNGDYSKFTDAELKQIASVTTKNYAEAQHKKNYSGIFTGLANHSHDVFINFENNVKSLFSKIGKRLGYE